MVLQESFFLHSIGLCQIKWQQQQVACHDSLLGKACVGQGWMRLSKDEEPGLL